MNNENTIVVYVTTYNRASYLDRMLESIKNQTYKNFIVRILDNHSTDNTKEIASKYLRDERFSYKCNTENIGGIGNINAAFERAEGEFFYILHDDDICKPTLFEEEVNHMIKNPGCIAVSCLADYINEEEDKIRKSIESSEEVNSYSGTDFFDTYIEHQKNFVFPATLYRSKFFRKKKITLNHNVGPSADVVLYMDIEKAGGRIDELQKTLFSYRVYSNQDSSINLESMLLQLMTFISNDPYYGQILTSRKQEREKYFRWYGRRLIVRLASNKINTRDAIKNLEEMKMILKGSEHYSAYVKQLLLIESLFPKLSSFGYGIITGLRRRGR